MSYVSAYSHWVFSTKDRRPFITAQLQERLWPFLGGIARANNEIQEEPPRKVTFQEEFTVLLKKDNIEYDQRYLWE